MTMLEIKVEEDKKAKAGKTLSDLKQIICGVYCKSYAGASNAMNSTCDSCSLNPKYHMNFELGSNVKPLVDLEVLHDGTNLIQEFAFAEHCELSKKFKLEG